MRKRRLRVNNILLDGTNAIDVAKDIVSKGVEPLEAAREESANKCLDIDGNALDGKDLLQASQRVVCLLIDGHDGIEVFQRWMELRGAHNRREVVLAVCGE